MAEAAPIQSDYDADDHVTPKTLSDRINISQEKLSKDRQRGIGIPFTKFGRSVLYRWGDALEYLEAGRVSTN